MSEGKRPAEAPGENSVCAELSRWLPLFEEVAPDFAAQLEGKIREIGDEVRADERERLAALLETWAASDTNYQRSIAFVDAAARIRGMQ